MKQHADPSSVNNAGQALVDLTFMKLCSAAIVLERCVMKSLYSVCIEEKVWLSHPPRPVSHQRCGHDSSSVVGLGWLELWISALIKLMDEKRDVFFFLLPSPSIVEEKASTVVVVVGDDLCRVGILIDTVLM